MFDLQEQDESIHSVADEPTWREAAYFDFYDPDTGLAALGYLGVYPHQEMGEQVFALWQKDVLLARFTRWDFNLPRDIGEDRFSFGPLHYYPRVPFKQCNWYYDDGACRLDVTFHAVHQPYSWAEPHNSLTKINSHHYEQQGLYMGFARVGHQTYKILGVGTRDHVWGWKASAEVKRWVWASAQFNDKFAFNTFHIEWANDEQTLYGYVYRGEENILLRRSYLEVAYDPKRKTPQLLNIGLQDCRGNELFAEGRILNVFDTSHQERSGKGYHFFCFTDYTCDGLTGYGQSNHYFLKGEYRAESWEVEDPGAS